MLPVTKADIFGRKNVPENWWLGDDPFLLKWLIFRGKLLVSERVVRKGD